MLDYRYNIPTELYDAGYTLRFYPHYSGLFSSGSSELLDSKGNIIKRWSFIPSFADLIDLVGDLQLQKERNNASSANLF